MRNSLYASSKERNVLHTFTRKNVTMSLGPCNIQGDIQNAIATVNKWSKNENFLKVAGNCLKLQENRKFEEQKIAPPPFCGFVQTLV